MDRKGGDLGKPDGGTGVVKKVVRGRQQGWREHAGSMTAVPANAWSPVQLGLLTVPSTVDPTLDQSLPEQMPLFLLHRKGEVVGHS